MVEGGLYSIVQKMFTILFLFAIIIMLYCLKLCQVYLDAGLNLLGQPEKFFIVLTRGQHNILLFRYSI